MVRRDLPDGYQAVQSSHALIDFIMKHPEVARDWHENSNYLGQFSVADENDLGMLMEKAIGKGIKVVPFYEPDLNDELTAIALEPSLESRRITSSLPLMLKRKQEPVLI